MRSPVNTSPFLWRRLKTLECIVNSERSNPCLSPVWFVFLGTMLSKCPISSLVWTLYCLIYCGILTGWTHYHLAPSLLWVPHYSHPHNLHTRAQNAGYTTQQVSDLNLKLDRAEYQVKVVNLVTTIFTSFLSLTVEGSVVRLSIVVRDYQRHHKTGEIIPAQLCPHLPPPYSSKFTIEVVHGLMGQVIKDQLFNGPALK